MNLAYVLGAATIGLVIGMALFAWRVLGDMASDEVRGWLDIAPRAILRLAGARINREQRQRLYYEEWLPELEFIMKEAEGRPITRASRALKFALGLLLAAGAVSRLGRRTPPAPATNRIRRIGKEQARMLVELNRAIALRKPQRKHPPTS